MRRESTATIVIGIVVLIVIAVPIVLFSFGEDLFGSGPGTIDDYNRDTLESCQVPDGMTLVRVYVERVEDVSGNPFRTMGFVYATPRPSSEVAAALGVETGYESLVPESHACRFGNRPRAWVVDVDAADSPGDTGAGSIWGGLDAAVESERPIPPDTRSLVRLRLAQAERDGVVG